MADEYADERSYSRMMRNVPEHWSEMAGCLGDERFIADPKTLTGIEVDDMKFMCAGCEVFSECADWAQWYGDGVFAAGKFRLRVWPEENDDGESSTKI